MSRTAWTLSGLLAVALVLSYVTWQHPPVSAAATETEIVSVKPSDVTRVVYTRTHQVMVPAPAGKKPTTKKVKTTVTLTAATDAAGHYWKVEAETEGKKQTFVGGRMLHGVITALAPLKAFRVLEGKATAHRKALGLDPPEGRLTLSRGDRTWHFLVGGASYGSVRRYLMRQGGHDVYLVGGMPFRLLSSSPRELMARDVVGLAQPDIAKVTVSSGDKTVTMVQSDRAHRFKSFWARPDAPRKKVAVYGNWLQKVFRLRASDYLTKAETPKTLDPVATLVFEAAPGADGPSKVTVTLLRGPEVKGQPTYYVRATATRGLVAVRGASEVVGNLGSVLGTGS